MLRSRASIYESSIYLESVPKTGLPQWGKSQRKPKIFQGQGKVREFFKKDQGKSLILSKSGNSVFWFIVHKFSSRFWNAFSFAKIKNYAAKQGKRSIWHSCSSWGQWFSLWILSSKFLLPLSAKRGKRLKMKRKLSMACKKSKETVNMDCFSLIEGQEKSGNF